MATTKPLTPAQEPIQPNEAPPKAASKVFTSLSEKLQEQSAGQGVSNLDVWRVKIGGKPGETTESEMIFDMYKGEIYDPDTSPYYPCYIQNHRNKRSFAEFVINDPDGSILAKINRDDNVEIEVGRQGILVMNKFVGTVWQFGRRFNPNGAYVYALDKSASAMTPTSGIQEATANGSTPNDPDPPQFDFSNFEINTQDDVLTLIDQVSALNANGDRKVKGAESAFEVMLDKNGNPKFLDASNYAIDKTGRVLFNQSPMEKAVQDAIGVGDNVITRGNTTSVVSPGNEPDSGVIINLRQNPSAFLPGLKITRPGATDPNSPYGAFTSIGHDIRTGEVVGATVVVPAPATPHPTGIISVPQWKDIKLSDPIFDGCPYTWADATMNGSRVPESKKVIEEIIRIAQIITPLTQQTVGTGKWKINSWYRDRKTNSRIPGAATNSQHISGNAVDFFFSGMNKLHSELSKSHNGGVAISHGSFVHIDAGPRRRWTYR